eukprot:COSAG02_NODE_42993_length_379_cov_0.739286_1_plen_109_part_10
MLKKIICALSIVGILFIAGCGGQKEINIEIKPLGNQMKYETTRFEVTAGQSVKLTLKNTATSPAMKHNVVILSDKSKIQEIGSAAITAENYLPKHPAILVATPIVDAGK